MKPIRRGSFLAGWPKLIWIPSSSVISSFLSFFPFSHFHLSLQGNISDCRNSSLVQRLFFYLSTTCICLYHFTTSIFMCIYLKYRIKSSKTRRSNSPQFSCYWSCKTINHGLNHWKIYTAWSSILWLSRSSFLAIEYGWTCINWHLQEMSYLR